MRRSLVKFSESEASNHAPSLADFTTTTPELKFSVHTGPAEGQAYRQGAKDYSHRAVQGPQGSARYAVAQDARSVATVVEGAPNALGHGRAAGGALVVSRP